LAARSFKGKWLVFLSLFFVFFLQNCDKKKPWTGMYTPGDTVDNVGYHPDQPIKGFSHKVHAEQKKIPCEYCHSSARRSAVAGIPPMNTCMGCHKIVRTDAPDIKLLTEKYEKNEPIEWTKVHDLPDFVRFTHKRHVQSGLDCAECHGDVKTMDTVQQVAPLQMGWCVDCHKQKGAPTACFTCHY
jgi:hypothetical protein